MYTQKLAIIFDHIIVISGDWLWKAANINDKNNSAAINATFLLVSTIKMIGILLNVVHFQVHKNI